MIACSRPPPSTCVMCAAMWAGLRSSPDRSPVIGYDERSNGYFWLAGQGGYGIQTAPADGALVAALVNESPVPQAA